MPLLSPKLTSFRFKDNPISVTVALDLVLIPLAIMFSGFVKAVEATIFEKEFFKFSMDPIRKNIFTITTKSKDTTPPVFSGPCRVEQAVGRPETAPGVMMSFDASEPDTKVESAAFFIGSSLGASDIAPEVKVDLSLKETYQPLKVASAMGVFFGVKACNTDGYCASTSCQLSSWDVDPTRFSPVQVRMFLVHSILLYSLTSFVSCIFLTDQDYDIQSHPNEIEASFGAEDESAIISGTLQWAFGTTTITAEKVSDESTGSDIYPWVNVTVPPPSLTSTLAHQITGVSTRVKLSFDLVHNQVYFLNVKAQNRLLYWGADASKGVLVDLIPPFPQDQLDLIRCSQQWIDFYNRSEVMNNLIHQGNFTAELHGCEHTRDGMFTSGCAPTKILDWHHTHLSDRCVGPTPLPNHRTMVDSGSVFNGVVTDTHTLYQFEQTAMSISWYVPPPFFCQQLTYLWIDKMIYHLFLTLKEGIY
jgi:hypothetical protein